MGACFSDPVDTANMSAVGAVGGQSAQHQVASAEAVMLLSGTAAFSSHVELRIKLTNLLNRDVLRCGGEGRGQRIGSCRAVARLTFSFSGLAEAAQPTPSNHLLFRENKQRAD